MKNTSLVTISTAKRSIAFSVGPRLRNALTLLAYLIVAFAAIGVFVIYEFSTQITTLSQRKSDLDKKIVMLNSTVQDLQNEINTHRYAFEKLNELEALTETPFLVANLSLRGKASPLIDVPLPQNQAFEQQQLLNRIDQIKLSLVERKWLLDAIPNGDPMAGKHRVTSKYGRRIHPVTGKRQFHYGVDMKAAMGDAVMVTADGVVKFSGYNRHGFGKVVIVVHNYGFVTKYAHLSKLLVKKGEFVSRGQILGDAGSTGISTGVHLHYEIEYLDANLNPNAFTDWSINNYNDIFTREKSIAWSKLVSLIRTQVKAQVQPQLLPMAVYSKEN